MKRPLNVLIVEDSEEDLELLVHALVGAGYEVIYERVETADAMARALERTRWDLVLSDYSLPSFSAPAALDIAKATGQELPFIIVSGTIGEETAVSALKAGAHDFLVKGRLARLAPAIEREMRDAAQRREHGQALKALHQSEAKHRSLVEHAVFGIYQATVDGRFLTVNPALVAMLGYESADELLAIGLPNLFVDQKARSSLMERVRAQHEFTGEEVIWQRKTGESIRVRISGRVLDSREIQMPTLEVIVEDITQRFQLEEQLRQSQKMEAVGRLAGGIAHDFNNLLTAILVYTELLLERVEDRPDLTADLQEIRKATDRAAGLTKQLLAFSRKQVLQPQIVDLNHLVIELEKMLRRLIGEDVRLKTITDPAIGRIKADPGQIEQVVMNLTVNARDAMPRGGLITIQTAISTLPPELAHLPAGPPATAYVSLMVRDTGHGMSPEVRKQIFEPFFSTKSPDKGTGLGLSTVYGIVTQSGGYITVDSERDRGTTFTIYLPVAEEAEEAPADVLAKGESCAGTETILLVDDEPGIQLAAATVLRRYGYSVLEAGDTATALTIARSHPGPIDLLVSDVVMPGLNGPDLAQWIVACRPDVRVLYISGYPHLATAFGSMSGHTTLLQKPFTPEELARKVRERLDLRTR